MRIVCAESKCTKLYKMQTKLQWWLWGAGGVQKGTSAGDGMSWLWVVHS